MCVYHGANQGNYKKMEDGDTRLRRALHPHDSNEVRNHIRSLYIYREQIMFDVESQVSMLTRSRRQSDGTESNTETDMLEKYKGQFDRWIMKHIEKVKEQLIIAVLETYNESIGNTLKDCDEIEIKLVMPKWWDDTAWRSLVDTVHDYIVHAVLSEYYKIILTTKDPLTQSTIEDADDSYAKIKALLCQHKAGTIKRPLRPLGI